MNDAEAFAYYDNPANREPAASAPHRRPDRPATQHVPVLLPRETVEHVRRLADAEGMTGRAWVRLAVDEKVRRRTGDERPDSLR